MTEKLPELLGFDLRPAAAAFIAPLWNAERRDRFLLAPETPLPLSVDTLVWPSLFAFAHSYDLTLPNFEPITVGPADFRDESLKLFFDPAEMYGRFFAAANPDASTADPVDRTPRFDPAIVVPIAVTLTPPFTLNPDSWWTSILEPRTPVAEIPPAWSLLGYDVADAAMLSALMNTGFSPEDRAELAPVWRPLLNRNHLFADPNHATAYTHIAADRTPEHAPFFVYGLWQIHPQNA